MQKQGRHGSLMRCRREYESKVPPPHRKRQPRALMEQKGGLQAQQAQQETQR
jgi:hypothetical protein